MEYFTNSEQELIDLGEKLAVQFKPGEIILLQGDLGAGKTTLTKGVAKYFGVKKNITSPTFSLMNVYEIQNSKFKIQNLIHIDTYRLENEEKLIEIGAEDYLGSPNTICLIEWPEKLNQLLENKKIIKITIEHLEKGRKIIIN